MKENNLIKVRALVDETGLDDFGASGLTFPVQQLIKGKIYEQADTKYWTKDAKNSPPFFVDDNGCSRDIARLVKYGIVELVALS